MSNVYLVTVGNVPAGISESFGLAVERAYHKAVDDGYVDALKPAPEMLHGSPFEGTSLDRMIRALEGDRSCSGISLEKHDLDVRPDEDSRIGIIGYSREEVPTSAVQQAIYDLALGADEDEVRTKLTGELAGFLLAEDATFRDAESILTKARETGRYIGSAFVDRVVPFPGPHHAGYAGAVFDVASAIPAAAMTEFNKAAEYVREQTLPPKP